MPDKNEIIRMILGGWQLKTIKSRYDSKYHGLIKSLFKEYKGSVKYHGSCMSSGQNVSRGNNSRPGVSWSEAK